MEAAATRRPNSPALRLPFALACRLGQLAAALHSARASLELHNPRLDSGWRTPPRPRTPPPQASTCLARPGGPEGFQDQSGRPGMQGLGGCGERRQGLGALPPRACPGPPGSATSPTPHPVRCSGPRGPSTCRASCPRSPPCPHAVFESVSGPLSFSASVSPDTRPLTDAMALALAEELALAGCLTSCECVRVSVCLSCACLSLFCSLRQVLLGGQHGNKRGPQ